MFLRFSIFVLSVVLGFATVGTAQESNDQKSSKNDNKAPTADTATADQIAESAILIYGGLLGRQNLNQIRKTTFERGKTTYTDANGRKNVASYERFIVRGETMAAEKVRLDQTFSDARYSLVFNADKIYGLYNETVFTPREDASKAFQDQIWHSIESLLRYKENESKLELGKREKLLGVDFYVVDLTDKQGRKTRYFISVKRLRVMMLEYESEGVKFQRRFYDYNYAQGTLVPYRTVLIANDREIEETDIGTVTFGQKIEETLFQQ